MRKCVSIFISLFLAGLGVIPAQVDTTRFAELDSRLERYFRTLEAQDAEVKMAECDLLVSSTEDSLLRQRVALKAYGHYLDSPLMGDDAVAVHLVDTWFAPGKVRMKSEVDLLNANVFALFNRQSLIGCEAPELLMCDPEGSLVKVGGASDRLRVLFFFDTDCAKCRLETILLKRLLEEKDWPIDFFAIYSGSDRAAWDKWRASSFDLKTSALRLSHLWDPELTSDFQMKYGVVQTPRLFLLGRDGRIVGRGLDSQALETLVELDLREREPVYGDPASMELLDKLFSFYEPVKAGNVLEVAAMLEARTLPQGDTLAFKSLEGSLLHYLSSKRGEQWCEGTLSFINEYVFSRPGLWASQSDSLQIVGLASLMSELLSRPPLGSRIPKTSYPGWNRLRRRGGLLVFHTSGCKLCEAQLAAAEEAGLRYLAVNIDEILAEEALAPGRIEGSGEAASRLERTEEAFAEKVVEDQGLASGRVDGVGEAATSAEKSEEAFVSKKSLRGLDKMPAHIETAGVRTVPSKETDKKLSQTLFDTFDLSSLPFIIEVSRRGIVKRKYLSLTD